MYYTTSVGAAFILTDPMNNVGQVATRCLSCYILQDREKIGMIYLTLNFIILQPKSLHFITPKHKK